MKMVYSVMNSFCYNIIITSNEPLLSEVSSFLLLEHASTITRLQPTIEEMTEKMHLLDEKIAQLTKGKDMQ